MRSTITSRLAVWGRVLTAFPLGYGATSLVVVAVARLLPGPAIQASVTAGLLAFPIYAALIIYIFAAPSALRGFVVTLSVAVTSAVVAGASILLEGRL